MKNRLSTGNKVDSLMSFSRSNDRELSLLLMPKAWMALGTSDRQSQLFFFIIIILKKENVEIVLNTLLDAKGRNQL